MRGNRSLSLRPALPPRKPIGEGQATRNLLASRLGYRGRKIVYYSVGRNGWKAESLHKSKISDARNAPNGSGRAFLSSGKRTRSGGKGRGEKAILWVKIRAAAR